MTLSHYSFYIIGAMDSFVCTKQVLRFDSQSCLDRNPSHSQVKIFLWLAPIYKPAVHRWWVNRMILIKYCKLSKLLILYWIWVSVPNSPCLSFPFFSLLSLSFFSPFFSFFSCFALFFSVFSYVLPFDLFSHFCCSFSFPTCQLFLSLSFFCPSTSTFTCLSAFNTHLHSFIASLHPSKPTLSLSYLSSLLLFFFFSRMSTCIGSGPHHILQPSKPSSIHWNSFTEKVH